MHLVGAAARRVCTVPLALLLLVGLLVSTAAGKAAADDEPVRSPVLLATASITRTDLSSRTETYSTQTAKVAGSLAEGLWVDWQDESSGTVVNFESSEQRPLHTGVVSSIHDADDDMAVYGSQYFDPLHGEFEVLDLATDSEGRFTRFDIVFVTSTTYPSNAAFGEVRLNVDAPSNAVSPSARALHWPLTPRHPDPLFVVETLTNTSKAKVKLGKAKLGQGAASDYQIRHDRCSNRTLVPAASCTLQVGFSPTHGGPRAANLKVPAGSSPITISLAGAAMIGTSKLTVSGSYAPDGGKKTVYREVWVDPDDRTTSATTGYRFTGYVQTRGRPYGFDMGIGGPRPFARGTHETHEDPTPGEAYRFSVLLGYRCYGMAGTITVNEFKTDARNVPTTADIDINQRCDHVALKARLQWQDRHDLHAPSRPTQLHIAGKKARWKNASAKDYAATVVRVLPGTGADATPLNGYAVSSSRATSAALPALTKGQQYVLVAYSLDKTGNASAPRRLTFIA